MKDQEGSRVRGRTSWRRFTLAALPAAVAAGALLFGVAAGAFPAKFHVSGQEFKVSADKLDGTSFVQYPDWDTTLPENPQTEGANLPVARSVIGSASLTNLCQSVKMPDRALAPFPGVDQIVLRIEAGGGDKPATAEDLAIGLTELSGDATFTNIQIGNDARDISDGPAQLSGLFGQRSDRVEIDGLQQVAYSTSAGTFRLNGLSLRVMVDDGGECF